MQKWFQIVHGKIIRSLSIKEVSFNVYQRASEKPVLRILKNLKPKYFNEKYLIKDKNGSIVKNLKI